MARRISVVITADFGCLPLQSFYVEVCRRYTVLEGASKCASDWPEDAFRMLARTQASRFWKRLAELVTINAPASGSLGIMIQGWVMRFQSQCQGRFYPPLRRRVCWIPQSGYTPPCEETGEENSPVRSYVLSLLCGLRCIRYHHASRRFQGHLSRRARRERRQFCC